MKLPLWPNPQNFHHIELGLDRVYKLLKRVGNPHLNLPPTIHVAGTNGKGSTLAFLKSIFNEAGLKVHRYISPHLVNFNERIEICGEEISDEFLNEALEECQKACEQEPKIPITFFEGTTVAAFLAFSRVKADILLLETGLGGEFDATNVLNKVLCSIITTISFDHQEFLGKTLTQIAKAKSGIIKKNCDVIIANQKDEALEVIKETAKKLNARLFFASQEDIFLEKKFDLEKLKIPLLGSHQTENARLAVACSLIQNQFSINEEQIISGILKTKWPARLQKITRGRFFEMLSENFELYLDGSHNLQGSETVKEFLSTKKKTKKFIIFSMLSDKDCKGFLENISGEIDHEIDEFLITEITSQPKMRSAQEIFSIANELNLKTRIIKNFDLAFEEILQQNNNEKSLILVCGSLYLAGQFLEENTL